MRISASLKSDYLFTPSYDELTPFLNTFEGIATQVKQGWTLTSYNDVPKATIIGAEYFGEIATKTASFDTKQALLHSLKLNPRVSDGKIINVELGAFTVGKGISEDSLGFQALHIPQLYTRQNYKGNEFNVITSVNGNYDFLAGIFSGYIEFQDVRTLWNV